MKLVVGVIELIALELGLGLRHARLQSLKSSKLFLFPLKTEN
jgi:hypothetical protein